MPAKPRRSPSRFLGFAALAVFGIGGAIAYTHKREADREESVLNYRIDHVPPHGWQKMPPSPQTLFAYRNPKTTLLLRGAVNQVVSDENPTPDMKTDNIAQYYVDLTGENQPNWKAQMLDSVNCEGSRFRLIRRETKGKCVITAYTVKGNTTLLVSLSADGDKVPEIDREMPDFRHFLSTVKLTQENMN